MIYGAIALAGHALSFSTVKDAHPKRLRKRLEMHQAGVSIFGFIV